MVHTCKQSRLIMNGYTTKEIKSIEDFQKKPDNIKSSYGIVNVECSKKWENFWDFMLKDISESLVFQELENNQVQNVKT